MEPTAVYNKYMPMKTEAKQADEPKNILQGKAIDNLFLKLHMFLVVFPYGMVSLSLLG